MGGDQRSDGWAEDKRPFLQLSHPNVHCPHEETPDGDKEAFYAKLGEKFDSCPPRDVKIVIGDLNARIGREEMYRPVIAPYVTNDNGQRCINFAAS